ncbi:MAG: hypothetical protein M1826_006602 [Phylliscum demangeonii]|nr:MAG: hypothetical protein M1826_006602 [Phylliscum demangeonii]
MLRGITSRTPPTPPPPPPRPRPRPPQEKKQCTKELDEIRPTRSTTSTRRSHQAPAPRAQDHPAPPHPASPDLPHHRIRSTKQATTRSPGPIEHGCFHESGHAPVTTTTTTTRSFGA